MVFSTRLFAILILLAVSSSLSAAVVPHSGNITAPTVWSAADTHLIIGNVTITTGITLTIEPGAVVKFNSNTLLTVSGVLNAVGTPGNEIVFTSYRDDSVGGDTNADGVSFGQPGDWDHIGFNSSTIIATRLESVDIRYGGSGGNGSVIINNVDVTVINSRITDSSSYGISTYDSSPLLEGNTISGNSVGLYHYFGSPVVRGNTITKNIQDGIYAINITPTIDGNIITDNLGWGIYFDGARTAPVITGNTVTGNQRGVRIPATAVPAATDGNILLPNNINGITILGNTRTSDMKLSVLSNGTAELNTYEIVDIVTMGAGTTLTVDPGVIIKFTENYDNDSGFIIHGNLQSVGTAQQRVVYTATSDDAHGGDFNGDGSASKPSGGNWGAVFISSQSLGPNNIAYTDMYYGGNGGYLKNGILSIDGAAQISNSVLANSSRNGISSYGSGFTMTMTEIYGNGSDGIQIGGSGTYSVSSSRIYANLGDGVTIGNIEGGSSATATITNSEIFANTGFGIYVYSPSLVEIDAVDNWWGAIDGPSGVFTGSGDAVTANVAVTGIISGFKTTGTAFSYFDAGPNLSEGTLAGPTVLQGISSSEFGTTAPKRMLYDVNRVSLDYASLNPATYYDVLVTYYNPDDTGANGGTIQRLTDATEQAIHGSVLIPTTVPTQQRYSLPLSTYSSSTLRLNFIRENGYRATVSQVWLIARAADISDTTAPVTAIVSPATGGRIGGGSLTITGTATDLGGIATVQVGINDGSATIWRAVSQLQSNGNWSYLWNLPIDGSYTISARAIDLAGNIEISSASVAVVVDQTAPLAASNVYATDTIADAGNSIDVFWTVSLDDGAGANDLVNYEIERRPIGGVFVSAGVVVAGSTSVVDTAVVTDTRYEYRVISIDGTGNRSASTIYGPVMAVDNNIVDSTAPADVTTLTGKPGNQNVNLSWTPSADTDLDLVDQQLDISVDGGVSWGSTAPAYNDGATISLGKAVSNYLVAGLTNGQGYLFRIRVKDAATPANVSVGTTSPVITPSATAYTTVSGVLSVDTVWFPGVYYVSSSITVNSGVTLSIMPGTIIKFAPGAQLISNGVVLAEGTVGNPIVFTAFTDDSVGGDTNNDGASTGTAGYWQNLYFNGTGSSGSRVVNSVVRYAGGGVNIAAAITTVTNTNVSLLNNTITDSAASGIESSNASPQIEGNNISNNRGHGIFIGSSSPTSINNNSITNNGDHGIYYQSAANALPITNNTITGNAKTVRLPFSAVPSASDGNTLAPNTNTTIYILGNYRIQDLALSAGSTHVYYQIDRTTASIAAGSELSVSPGVIWKFGNGALLNIRGVMKAVGVLGNEIVFTSYRDDSVGGDTNEDGPSVGLEGDWQRIDFSYSVVGFLTRLESVDIRYGGGNSEGSIYINRADIAIVNSRITDGSSYGIYSSNTSALLEGNTISGHKYQGLYLNGGSPVVRGNTITNNERDGLVINSASPTIDGNTITDNLGWGIYFNYASTTPVITGNTVTGNERSVRLPASAVPSAIDGNVLLPNKFNSITILGNTRTSDLQLSVLSNGGAELNTYEVSRIMTMSAGTTLTVDPGVIIKFTYYDSGLNIHGNLQAVGTAQQHIVFTSVWDEAHGGDFNGYGSLSTPAPGSWGGIFISSQSLGPNNIAYTDMYYGGSGPAWSHKGSNNLYLESDTQISNSVLAYSKGHGIESYGNVLNMTATEIYGNGLDGMRIGINGTTTGTHTISGSRIYANLGDGIKVADAVTATINNNEIFANTEFGINNLSLIEVDAVDNWWGAVDGPSGAFAGSGDAVTANVAVTGIISGFKTTGTAFSYFDAGPNLSEGTLAGPTVLQGTPTSDGGVTAPKQMLYDFNRVSLDYTGLDPAIYYDVLVTYYNPDNTSATGGSIQRLTDVVEQEIHGGVLMPTTVPSQQRYALPLSAYSSGALRLNFIRENGIRATVSQVWLVARAANITDTTAPVTAIANPAAGTHFGGSTTTTTITGTVTDLGGIETVQVGVNNGSTTVWRAVNQLHSNGSWSYLWNLPIDGNYTISARAIDLAGNVEIPTASVAVVVDHTAPLTVSNVYVTDTLADAGNSLDVFWTLSGDDGAGANDVVNYEIERRPIGGAFVSAGVVAAGSTSAVDAAVLTGTQYEYQVVSIDSAGNRSVSTIYGPAKAIDNNIADNTAPADVTALTGRPGNQNVYLSWTRSADTELDLVDQLLDISADGGASWGSAAPAYNDGGTISLGKLSSNYYAQGLTNGQGYLFRIRVKDVATPANVSVGVLSPVVTPSATAYTTVSGTLPANTVWNPGVYYVSSSITVNAGNTLTIMPGAIIKFAAGTALNSYGVVLAEGTVANPIVFTAFTDDSVGGDSNNDGASTGTAGYWSSLYFSGAESAGSRVVNSVVRYAGRGNAAISVNNYANVSLLNNVISDSSTNGIYTYRSAPQINGNTISNNVGQGIFVNIYLYASTTVLESPASIDSNIITNNGDHGIYYNRNYRNALPITNNTITGNGKTVRLPFYALPGAGDGNIMASNTNTTIYILGDNGYNIIGRKQDLTLSTGSTHVYYLVSDKAIMAAGTILKIGPNVIWKFGNATELDINGGMNAVGALGNEIVFTSYRDDSVGGDTNEDGPSVGLAGDWLHIEFTNSAIDFITRLESVDIRYAGGTYSNGSVYINRADIAIVNSRITDSNSYGIFTSNASPLLQGNTISGHSSYGLYLAGTSSPVVRGNTITNNSQDGIYASGSSPTIDGNTITDNLGWGIRFPNATTTSVITGNTVTGNQRGVRIPATAVPAATDGNVLLPNSINGIAIVGNTRTSDLQLSVLSNGAAEQNTYEVDGNMTMGAGTTLTVDPGVIVKFTAGSNLTIDGNIQSVGTAQQHIVYTSTLDDAHGGDFNGDGLASMPTGGSWGTVAISALSLGPNNITYTDMYYGGNSVSNSNLSLASDTQISNSVLANSSGHGIESLGNVLNMTATEIYGNGLDGMRIGANGTTIGTYTVSGSRIYANLGDGIEVVDAVTATITNNEIFANTGFGVNNLSLVEVNAVDNWWGAIDGPSGVFAGSGDAVTSNVAVSDLVNGFKIDGTQYSYFNAGGSNHRAYVISTPNVTGTASQEWGVADSESFLFDSTTKRITADYTGLSASSAYRLFVTYLNQDIGGSVQKITDVNGNPIHAAFSLPATKATTYEYIVPKNSINTGNLSLNLEAVSGPRAVVSGLYLIEKPLLDSSNPLIAINSPINGQTLPAGVHLISGTANDVDSGISSVVVGITAQGAATNWVTVTNLGINGNWTYRWDNPTSGNYTLSALALDQSGNQQLVASSIAVTVDDVIPTAVSNLLGQGRIDGVQLNWDLSADDGAGNNDVTAYEIYRKASLTGSFQLIASNLAASAQYIDLTAAANSRYYYYVRTVDQAGNTSDSTTVGPVTVSATADTTAPQDVPSFSAQAAQLGASNVSAYLRWYASANTEGDLTGYRLYISVDGGATYGNNAPLHNDGTYTAFGNIGNSSYSAKSYHLTGLTAGTAYTFKLTTVDEVPNESVGAIALLTPTGSATESPVLTLSNGSDTVIKPGVFLVNSQLTVSLGTTLTIQPGTILKFSTYGELVVNGTLLAEGTTANPIVFTSIHDDSYGGDTDGNGVSNGIAGDWGSLTFDGVGSANSRLSNSVVRYSGKSRYHSNSIHIITGANVSIRSNTITDSSSAGIYIERAVPLIEGNTISNNALQGIHAYQSSGLVINGNTINNNLDDGILLNSSSSSSIDGNAVTNNSGYGIRFSIAASSPPLINNTITGNNISVLVPASAFPDASNVLTPNAQNYIGILGNDIVSDKSLNIWAKGTADEVSTYVIYYPGIMVPQSTVLTVEPGVTVKFAETIGIQVQGALVANGTVDENIVFTSLADDTVAGDTNLDGNASSPVNGDWTGIRFSDSFIDSVSHLNHVKVRYGGSGYIDGGALDFNLADVLVENSEISNNASNGIRINNASPTITGNEIWGNNSNGILIDNVASNPVVTFNKISTNLLDGISIVAMGNPTLTNNQLFSNHGYALRNGSGTPVDASQSWWGDADASGPYHATTNALGTGGQVDDNVTYAPFQTAVATEFAYNNFSLAAASTAGSMIPASLLQGAASDDWDLVNLSPERTMVWDTDRVRISYAGLIPTKAYKIRVSYLNSDSATVHQSVTDGLGSLVHSSQVMPSVPTQFEFPLPPSYYASGNLELHFINDNPATAYRAALAEVWIMEDVLEITPPQLNTIEYNDIDGDGVLSVGDEYRFIFSEAMNTTLIQAGTDANTKLPTDTGAIYGTVNQTQWSADQTTVTVTLTAGFTVTGTETVTPLGLEDKFANVAIGSQVLGAIDRVAPQFINLLWNDNDVSGTLTIGDSYVFQFSEAMNTSIIQDASDNANAYLPPAGGLRYGDVNTVSWSVDNRAVTVMVTSGFNILGVEQVIPSSFVTDVAGNSVVGTQFLKEQDIITPQITQIRFDDLDATGAVSIGDQYVISFSEAMLAAGLTDNSTDANLNLSPAGLSYGTINSIAWNGGNTEVAITVTTGFTITGNETVTPSYQLTDISGNAISNTFALTLLDTVAPTIISASGTIASPVSATNAYQVKVQFSSSVNTLVEPLVSIQIATGTPPTVPNGGTWSTTVFPNDTYTTPAITLSSALQGDLTVDISAAEDVSGNIMAPVVAAYSFVVETGAPGITNYAIAPAINNVTTANIILEGTRNDNTSVWVDTTEVVALGVGPWSANLTLAQGLNDLVVFAKDATANPTASVTVRFLVDSVAPIVGIITPNDALVSNVIPANVTVAFVETGSGLSIPNSTLNVTRGGLAVAGNWSSTASLLTFTPSNAFFEGDYQISIQLQDIVGLTSAATVSIFTLDQTPPAPPIVNAIPASTTVNQQLVSGTKEAGSAIWLNGQLAVANSVATTWSYTASLVNGVNSLSFVAKDQAGNSSQPSLAQITFDNAAPGPVTITANGVGDGTTVVLDWSAYDEVANGNDISNYSVYISSTNFTDTAAATVIATVPAGIKTYTAQGLVRGTNYYFAVAASDTQGNALTTVSATLVAPQDSAAPQDVSNVLAQSFVDRLVLTWSPSPDAGIDLANYKVYFNNDAGTLVVPTLNTYEIVGLTAATGYPVRITSIDNNANESVGVSVTGVTLLANPVGLTAAPLNAMVDINWTAATPSNLVKEYAIYASETDFTSVAGMTARLRVPSPTTTARLAGLTNNALYYIAVTTVNNSGGESDLVTTVTATPTPDLTGPIITGVTYNATPIADGASITLSGDIVVTATDVTGLSRIQFKVDGVEVSTDANGSDGYSAFWNIANITDGPHIISVTAYDTLNNLTTQDINVTVTLAAPAAPMITSPQNGLVSNDPLLNIKGTAEEQASVIIYLNAIQVAGPLTVDANGNFFGSITIAEGLNTITAAAQNRGGLGTPTAALQVTLDTSVPNEPTGLAASSRESGAVVLSWNASSDARVVGYDVYRSSVSFSDISLAQKANTNTIKTDRFDDLPAIGGTYFYRVVAVNNLGSASMVSNEVTGIADSVMPQADSIVYVSTGNVDSVSGRMAPGDVTVTVNVSEPLLTTPFLSITPNAGIPITVRLTKLNDLTYTGSFTLTANTKTGIAYAVFSARDVVGNRGNAVLVGSSINIDTDGPAVTVLAVTPGTPIKTDQATPVTINVEIELDDAPLAGTQPQLSYLLSGLGRLEITIDNLVPLQGLRWRGSFTLPADAGLTEVETLSFIFTAQDDLANISNTITAANTFQVYQGALPPLAAPANFTALAGPGGTVNLSWNAVQSAIEYQLYRQAPGETGLTPLPRILATAGTTHTDTTLVDGDYIYAIASVRQENGQEALSAQSAPITVSADATLPGAPQALTLELVGAGVKALWSAPAGVSSGLSYSLYRATGTTLTDVTGLTPIQTNIVANAQGILGFIDTHPDLNEPTYVVTAVDAVGNQSLPSNSSYLNEALLPVADLSVLEDGSGAPVISWTHNGGNISGYNVYLGTAPGIPLNSAMITTTSFTDSGYSGDTRLYTVTAIDINSVESIGRSVVLPQISTSLDATATLKRGVMNQLNYTVTNNGSEVVSGISVSVTANAHNNISQAIGLNPATSSRVPVIMGGFADLLDPVNLTTTTTITAATGEKVRIIRSQNISVADDSMLLSVQTQELTRGTAGQVRFTWQNTSQVETEILTALNATAASNQVRLFLKDLDGNVLSTTNLFQATGGVVALPNKNVVARVPAGASFTSAWISLPIPQSAPNDVVVVMEIDSFHYHLGESDHVAIGGMQSTQAGLLVDTVYTATVDNITPASSYGSDPITITGQAIQRSTALPLASVPVKLVISVNGFERSVEVITAADGSYSHVYQPQQTESGIFTVSAIHPAMLTRPAQGQFIVGQVITNYSSLNLRMARDISQTVNVLKATVGDGISATNLRWVYAAADQPGGVFPTGITLTTGAPINLSANQTAAIPFDVIGDATAAATGSLVLKLFSEESGILPLATIPVNYQIFESVPSLFFSPNFIETGVAHNGNVTEILTLENRGLTAMTAITVSMLSETGDPAPAWVYLTSPADQGDIAVGEKRQINMVANPPSTVLDGIYHFLLRITSSNHPTRDVNVYVSVTQSGIGGALFKVSDIYTATLDANGVPIPGLAGARIKLQNEAVLTVEQTLTTDASGEALFIDLPAGRYRYRASAPNHADLLGRISIKPGITVSEDSFLSYNLITVEWSVNEITIQDAYEVVLQATFETDVPAAVVIIEPTSTTVPDMLIGDVFNGELRITNYGLVRSDNLTYNLPTSDAYFRYEFPANLPTTLAAKESIIVPYKIIAIASLDSTGAGAGASCNAYSQRMWISYEYTCANGTIDGGDSGHTWTNIQSNNCGTTTTPGGTTGGSGPAGGGEYGINSGNAGTPVSLPGATCPIPCPDGTCCAGASSGSGGSGGAGGAGGAGGGGGGGRDGFGP